MISKPASLRNAGFTLIELLVVIAIIGILAAIVLASLNTARDKSKDAKIQEQMNSLRNAGEVYYTNNGNYGDVGATDCTTDGMALDTTSGFSSLVASSSWPDLVTPVCTTNADATNAASAFAVWHVMGDGTTYWCADSSGASKVEASEPAAGSTECP